MAILEMTITGADTLKVDLDRAGANAPKQVLQAVRKTALDVEGTAKRFAPVDLGTLRSSITTVTKANGSYVEATVAPHVDYAVYQEYGTSRMAPRAFMGPAADRHLHELQAAIEKLALL